MVFKRGMILGTIGLVLIFAGSTYAIDGVITFGPNKGKKVVRWEDALIDALGAQNEVLNKIAMQMEKNTGVLEEIATTLKEGSPNGPLTKQPSSSGSEEINKQLGEIKKNQEALMVALQSSIEQQKWQQKLLDSMMQSAPQAQPASPPQVTPEIAPTQEGEPVKLQF